MPQFHFQVFVNGQRLAKEDRTLRLSFADACNYAVGEMPQQLKTQLREDALDPAGNDRR